MLLFKLFSQNFKVTHAKKKIPQPPPFEKNVQLTFFYPLVFWFWLSILFLYILFFSFSFFRNSLAFNLFFFFSISVSSFLKLCPIEPGHGGSPPTFFFFFSVFISLILRAAAESIISFMSQPEAGNPCVPCLWILGP